MIEYEKIKIKNEEDIEELDLDDIEPLASFADIHFLNHMRIINNAIVFGYKGNKLGHRAAKLNRNVDWIIREYKENLYLIPLKKKKDC